jgi:hypothetical protein
MDRRTMMYIPMAAIFLAWSGRSDADDGRQPTPSPVRRVSHIMVRTDQPTQLYAFFTEVLQLPIAWPLATRGQVTSGGAGFGNVNIEAIQFPGQPSSPAHLVGFGFEPIPLPECLRELARRGIRYGDPRPFVSTTQTGSKKILFTNVTLQELSDADRPITAKMHIFLSEYSPDYVDVEQRRTRLRGAVQQSGGGPLGIKGVEEIVIDAEDWQKATTIWQRLLDPIRPSAPGLWNVGDGPSIRVVESGDNRVQTLTVSVHSLPRAKEFLDGRGLLGPIMNDAVTMDPSKLWGLDIRLIENK